MNGRKILATLVILAMLMSTMIVLNKLEINIMENACATPGVDEWGNATTDLVYNTTYADGTVKINTSKWAANGTYYLYYPTYTCAGAGPNADSFSWNGPYKVGVCNVKVVATQAGVSGSTTYDTLDTCGYSFSFNRSGMWIFDDDTTHWGNDPSSYGGYIWVNSSTVYTILDIADFEYGSQGSIIITVDTGDDMGCMIAIVDPDNTTVYHKWRATSITEAIGIKGNFTMAGDYTVMAYRDFDEDTSVYLYRDEGGNPYNCFYGSDYSGSFPSAPSNNPDYYNYSNMGPWDSPERNATNKRIIVLPGVPTTSIPEANATMNWSFPGQVNISVTDYFGNYIPGLNVYVFNSDDVNVTNNLTIYNGHSGKEWIWINSSSWGKDGSYVYGKNGTWYAYIFKDINGDGIEEWNCTVEWEVRSDFTPPNVEIIKPEEALYIFNLKIRQYLIRKHFIIGRIDIEVDASDNKSGTDRVEFFVDNELKSTDTTEPYSWRWDELKFLFLYTIKVVAYDKAGNSASDEIIVRKFL